MKTILFPLTLVLFLSACARDADTLGRKGIDALNAGDAAKATRLLEKAAEKSEDSGLAAEWWATGGLAAARAGQGGDAETFLTQALTLNPNLFEANYNMGDLLIQQNRLDEAQTFLIKASLLETGRTEALEALAGIALRQGELPVAVEYLNQARARNENVRVLTSLAVAGKNQFAVEETRNLLQRAVTLDPEYAPAQLNLAALLDQNRLDPAQAEAHYGAFLRLHPEDDKVPLVRQRMQIMEARIDSGEISRPDPVRQEVEDLLASATQAANAGDVAAVLPYCLRAHAVATRAQRSDLRERALRAATTLAPDSARAYFGLGQFMLSQGRKTEALVSIEKAQALAPGWPMALRPSVMLAVEMSQKTMAQKMLTSAETAGATHPALLLDVGDLYAEALNLDKESRRVYREIVEKFPNDASATEAQARLER